MSPEQFAYWLKGFTELNNGAMPSEAQWRSINDHLKTVFNKVTPDRFFGTTSIGTPITSPGTPITQITC